MDTDRTLPAELTIYTVGEWHPRCMAWVSGGADTPCAEGGVLRVQAGGVTEVDAAGVQLLLSIDRYLSARDERLELADASPVLVDACKALGVAGLVDTIPEGAAHGQ